MIRDNPPFPNPAAFLPVIGAKSDGSGFGWSHNPSHRSSGCGSNDFGAGLIGDYEGGGGDNFRSAEAVALFNPCPDNLRAAIAYAVILGGRT